MPSGERKTGTVESVTGALMQAMRARATEGRVRDEIAHGMGLIYSSSVRATLLGGQVQGRKNSRLTLSTKAGATPLVHTGQMAGAWALRPGVSGEVIFSFKGGARAGLPLDVLVGMQERRGTQVVTARMVKFFRAAVLRDGWDRGFLAFREGDTIQRPARKVFAPAFKNVRDEIAAFVTQRLIAEWNALR